MAKIPWKVPSSTFGKLFQGLHSERGVGRKTELAWSFVFLPKFRTMPPKEKLLEDKITEKLSIVVAWAIIGVVVFFAIKGFLNLFVAFPLVAILWIFLGWYWVKH